MRKDTRLQHALGERPQQPPRLSAVLQGRARWLGLPTTPEPGELWMLWEAGFAPTSSIGTDVLQQWRGFSLLQGRVKPSKLQSQRHLFFILQQFKNQLHQRNRGGPSLSGFRPLANAGLQGEPLAQEYARLTFELCLGAPEAFFALALAWPQDLYSILTGTQPMLACLAVYSPQMGGFHFRLPGSSHARVACFYLKLRRL